MPPDSPVERSYVVKRASPQEVYAVVVDVEAYPRLFPELKAVRIVERRPAAPGTPMVLRVELRAQVVLAVRYVIDMRCDPDALTVDWTFVEGDVVVDSRGAWRFTPEGEGTKTVYRVSLSVKAPLPGFVLRKATDALVSASIPAMFASIEREVHRRRAAGPDTPGLPGT